jgi:ammonia channel protein AmtB
VILPAARGVLAKAGATAVRHDFVASLVRTLWFQVGAFVLSFLLMFALPSRAGRREEPAGTDREEAGTDRELTATGRN